MPSLLLALKPWSINGEGSFASRGYAVVRLIISQSYWGDINADVHRRLKLLRVYYLLIDCVLRAWEIKDLKSCLLWGIIISSHSPIVYLWVIFVAPGITHLLSLLCKFLCWLYGHTISRLEKLETQTVSGITWIVIYPSWIFTQMTILGLSAPVLLDDWSKHAIVRIKTLNVRLVFLVDFSSYLGRWPRLNQVIL